MSKSKSFPIYLVVFLLVVAASVLVILANFKPAVIQTTKTSPQTSDYKFNYREVDRGDDFGPDLNIDISYQGKIIKTLKSTVPYIPIELVGDKLYLVYYCSGLGGICQGSVSTFNTKTYSIDEVLGGAVDYYYLPKAHQLLVHISNFDPVSDRLATIDLQTGQIIDQGTKLNCPENSNLDLSCSLQVYEKNGQLVVTSDQTFPTSMGLYLTSTASQKAALKTFPLSLSKEYTQIKPIAKP